MVHMRQQALLHTSLKPQCCAWRMQNANIKMLMRLFCMCRCCDRHFLRGAGAAVCVPAPGHKQAWGCLCPRHPALVLFKLLHRYLQHRCLVSRCAPFLTTSLHRILHLLHECLQATITCDLCGPRRMLHLSLCKLSKSCAVLCFGCWY